MLLASFDRRQHCFYNTICHNPQMNSQSNTPATLRSYFILCTAASLAALVWLLWTPSTASNNLLVGYSVSRLLAAGFLALASVLFALLALSGKVRLQAWVDQISTRQAEITGAFFVALLVTILAAVLFVAVLPVFGGPFYPFRLLPLAAWALALGVLTLISLVLLAPGATPVKMFPLLVLLVILLSAVLVNIHLWDFAPTAEQDIYATYLEGDRLLRGVNPYTRVLDGDMRVNRKYATYFPIFYYLSWWTQKAGLRTFFDWLSLWRVVFLVFNILIAALVFILPARRGLLIYAVFAALFWCFNRWTLHVSRTFDIDFIPLFFLMLSLALFRRHRLAACLLFGLSLGIKQMGIFLAPLYLIWTWREARSGSGRRTVIVGLAIAAIPLLSSLPFLIQNAEGFIKSITFSATRDPAAMFEAYSLDTLLGVNGIAGKIPLLLVLLLLYWQAWKRKIPVFPAALLTMAVFAFFNSVLFTSYLVWLAPLIPLAALELMATDNDFTSYP